MFDKIKYLLDKNIVLSACMSMIVMMLIEYFENIVTRIMYRLEFSQFDWWRFILTSNLLKIFLFTLIYIYLLTKNSIQKTHTKNNVFLMLKFILVYIYTFYMMISIWTFGTLRSKIVHFSDLVEIFSVNKDDFILCCLLFLFPIVFVRKKVVKTSIFTMSLVLPFIGLLISNIYMEEYVSLYGGDGNSIIIIESSNEIFTFSVSPLAFTCSATLVLLLFVFHKIGRANNGIPIITASNSQQDKKIEDT